MPNNDEVDGVHIVNKVEFMTLTHATSSSILLILPNLESCSSQAPHPLFVQFYIFCPFDKDNH